MPHSLHTTPLHNCVKYVAEYLLLKTPVMLKSMTAELTSARLLDVRCAIFLGVLSQFDLRNLLVVNPHQVDEESLAREAGTYLEREAKLAVQSLVNRYYNLEPPIHRVLFLPALRTISSGNRLYPPRASGHGIEPSVQQSVTHPKVRVLTPSHAISQLAAAHGLTNRLFALPTVPSEVGPVASLPAKEESVLPRAKPVPAPKVLPAHPCQQQCHSLARKR